MAPESAHSAGMARLADAIRRAIDAPKPTLAFGCLPFTPDRDKERHVPGGPLHDAGGPVAKGRCKICRRLLNQAEPGAEDGGVDFLTCAGCHRGSPRAERICRAMLRADRQRRHLINHNRELTASTPVPAILLEPPAPEPEAPTSPPAARGKKRSPVPC